MIKNILSTLFLLFSIVSFSQGFTTIWNTSNLENNSSLDNQITIPTNPAYTYNYTVDWGDTMSNTGVTGNITHTYTTPGNYTITISGTFPSIYFNNEEANDKLKIIEILDWGTIEWQTMENAFYGCENLNFDAIDAPDLSGVTSLQNMFNTCTSFNGIVNNWDVSGITNISGIFDGAETFNRPLDNWTTNAITDMSYAFRNAQLFNEPLDNWNTSMVTTMEQMFSNANQFDQNINNWIVTSVTNMSGTFERTSNFNRPLNNWEVNNVEDMSSMFSGSNFNQPINNWIVNKVVDMSGMFANSEFNQALDNWNVSLVEDMSRMFQRNRVFNQPINVWDVSSVKDMNRMFQGVFSLFTAFNQPLDLWDVRAVTNMSGMFQSSNFNQPINSWEVIAVENMSFMFAGFNNAAGFFDQPLDSWVTTSVTNMSDMFSYSVFNQALEIWDVTNVTNMSSMFEGAQNFDQPLNEWDVIALSGVRSMFQDTFVFNQDLSNWNIENITNMDSMFNGAVAFDQNLGTWDITNITNMESMLSNSGLSQENYDTILIEWAAQAVSDNVELGATGLQYCDGRLERQDLIDNHGWSIIGDAINCTNVFCTTITSPLDTDTNVPANSDIRWAPAPNATGYRITLEIERNGVRDFVLFNGNIADNLDVGNVVGLDFTNEFNPDDTVFVTVVPFNDEGPAEGCEEISFTVVESWVNSPDAYRIQIDSRIDGFATTPLNQMEMEINNDFSYDYSIDWGDGQYNNNVSNDIVHTYLVPGIYTIAIIGDFPAPIFDTFGDGEKVLSIEQWGTHEYQSMKRACHDCVNMIYNATDIPNLSEVKDMFEMFNNARLFNGNINNWDVSNVTNMAGLFSSASVFNQPLDNWNVDKVEKMENMFANAIAFNQPLDNWNTDLVENMSGMFSNAMVFNQNINIWNVENVSNMSGMFANTDFFNQPLNDWNTGKVENMRNMFLNATAFNQNINSWNVTEVVNMSGMFDTATLFNQPLNDWKVSSVLDMSSMFEDAINFNEPLSDWEVNSVTDMSNMFNDATAFNQNLNSWTVTNVLTMESMFQSATNFNSPLNDWEVNSVVNMVSMFESASVFNQPMDAWDVSAVANMTSMFKNAAAFNQNINTWEVSSVTLMPSMFEGAQTFNQDLNNWDVSVVTNFNAMFKNAIVFNSALDMWDTGEALNMAEMFRAASAFNQNLDPWNVSFVTTMESMFRDATVYNQTMDNWNVASVTTMESMFQNATSFNSTIDSWNVRGVLTMENMFSGATNFNQILNNWRVSGVENMNSMFANAVTYNQTMDNWDIGSVSMRSMFFNATNLNQFLGDWNVSNVSDMRDMLDRTALTRENYDNTLISWSEQTLTLGINLGAESLPYCDALEERQSMIDNFGWTFTQDVLDCPIPECTQLISPINEATNVPVNTNLTWEPATFARGYRLEITIQPGGTIINETINNATSYEFATDFSGGEEVFVTIIPFNDTGDAINCNDQEESFTISTEPPSVPDCTSLIEQLANAVGVSVGSDLSWNPIANADGYILNVGTESGATDILNLEDVGNVTTFDIPFDLPEDREIFVTIIPYNEEGNAVDCIGVEESFTTELIPVPPACTTLSDPLNGATNVNFMNASLNWIAVDGATGYLVVVGTTQGGIDVANNINVGNTTNYNFPEPLQENRTHYVTIIPFNDVGDAMNCEEQNFRTGSSTVSDPLPSCTTLAFPVDGATDIATTITTISWDAVPNATAYRVTVNGSTSTINNITNQDFTTTSYTLPGAFENNETVSVTIIPFNDTGNAIGCTIPHTFTIINSTTMVPSSCANLTMTTTTDLSINLPSISWNSVPNATGYRLTITGTLNNNLPETEVTGTTHNFTNDFEEGETVSVTIIPFNADGDAVGCNTPQTFTIIEGNNSTIPDCTSLTLPINGSVDVPVDTNLNWISVPNAVGYRVSVTGSSNEANNVFEIEITSGTSYSFPGDFNNGEIITINITPYNSANENMVGCPLETFTIVNEEDDTSTNTTLDCTTLITPLDLTDVPVNTDLAWESVANADEYRLSIGTTSGGTDILDNEDVGFLTSYSLENNLLEGTTYYVNITPYSNSFDDPENCTEYVFTTVESPINDVKYGFSPDGDGINEFWFIEGIENHPDNIVTIYNRWGDMVFQIQGYNNTSNVFNGTANQKTKTGANVLPEGTYFFNFTINEPHNFNSLQGFVVIKR